MFDMTREEFSVLAKAINAMYEGTIKDQYGMELWYSMLQDLPYKQVHAALHKHMQSSVYPPKVADLRKGAAEITTGYRESGNEVWQKIDDVVRYKLPIGMPECKEVAQREFEKLPTPARRLLGNASRLIEMATEYTNKDYEVARASFVRDYYAEDARDIDIQSLKPEIQMALTGSTGQLLTEKEN